MKLVPNTIFKSTHKLFDKVTSTVAEFYYDIRWALKPSRVDVMKVNWKWERYCRDLLAATPSAYMNADGSPSDYKAKFVKVLLDNVRRDHLAQQSSDGPSTSCETAETFMHRFIIPLVVKVMPTLAAHELIAVQPMMGPVGQIQVVRENTGMNRLHIRIVRETVVAAVRKLSVRWSFELSTMRVPDAVTGALVDTMMNEAMH